MATKKKKAAAPPAKVVEAPKPAPDKPTLVALMAIAGRAYGKALQNLQRFAETYVLAVELYGGEAKREFRNKYPAYTDAMWSHCEAIGKHNLLPHFWLASDGFIAGVLRLEKSMEKQMNLVGALSDGKIETISEKGTIVLKSLDQLSRLEEVGIVFAMNSATSPEEIRKFAHAYRQEWKMMDKPTRPDFERIGDLLRVNHAIKQVNKNDWLAMGRLMGWTA